MLTDGITDVIIYNSPDDVKKKNRGFAFLEYDSHKSASMAKHRIGNGYTRVWGCDIIVDWADPQEEPDEDTMSKVVSASYWCCEKITQTCVTTLQVALPVISAWC